MKSNYDVYMCRNHKAPSRSLIKGGKTRDIDHIHATFNDKERELLLKLTGNDSHMNNLDAKIKNLDKSLSGSAPYFNGQVGASRPRIAAVPPTAWEALANKRHWWPTQEDSSDPDRDYHAIAVVIFVAIAVFYHFWQ